MEGRATVRLFAKALSNVVVLALEGREAVNELPWFDLTIAAKAVGDLESLLLAPVTLAFDDAIEGAHRSIPLVITQVELVDATPGRLATFALTLEPVCAVMRETSGYRVFVEKSTKDIVEAVFTQNGMADLLEWRLKGTYAVRPQCNQYDETDLQFFERLLADEGMSFWYDPDDEKPRLVIGDTEQAYESIIAPNVVPFSDLSGMLTVGHIDRMVVFEEQQVGAVLLRTHSPQRPQKPVDGNAKGPGIGFYFEYPARVVKDADAATKAQARLEQLARLSLRAEASSNVIRLAAGRRLVVSGCNEADMDGAYTLVEVSHRTSHDDSYRNDVVMVPTPRCFRPAPPVWPAIPSLEPAVTTGPGGEEIHVDDMGSVKIRMPWDRSGITTDKSSWWMRTMQMNLGESQILPRMGWEVPVMYYRGDPDRALVLGRMYNGQTAHPHTLPAAKATTNFGSATTPGGGTSNTITMVDTAGGQALNVNSSKDHSVLVGGHRKTGIAANLTHSVGLGYLVKITGDQTTTVGANQNLDVGTESSTSVKGSRTVTVGAVEHFKVKGNRTVKTTPYSESVGGLHGILCNEHNSDVRGAYIQNVVGAAGFAAGLGTGETVLGYRTHTVGGAFSITAVKYMEGSIGPKTVTSGASSVTAGAEIATHSANGTLTCGSLTVDASAEVAVEAGGSLTIDVSGSITTPGGVIGDGQIKITSGKESLDGPLERTSDTVIVQG
jgi:type VI secretion system secreted protein VgrG